MYNVLLVAFIEKKKQKNWDKEEKEMREGEGREDS